MVMGGVTSVYGSDMPRHNITRGFHRLWHVIMANGDRIEKVDLDHILGRT
jgi:hypothetical protein